MIIQWYPGHMVKARKLIKESIKLVDLALELVDARAPLASRNPVLDELLGQRPRIIILNKADLARPGDLASWTNYFAGRGWRAVAINSQSGEGINRLIEESTRLAKDMNAKRALKGMRPRPTRAIVVGIPNVGKSSLINRLAGRGSAKTGNLPGVTRGKQWVRLGNDFELLDTPGVLWPKFEDPEVGLKLALIGAIKDQVIDLEQVAQRLIVLLKELAPQELAQRFKLENVDLPADELLAEIGRRRGFLRSGGITDLEKAALTLMDEFRSGKIGRFTLDRIPSVEPIPGE